MSGYRGPGVYRHYKGGLYEVVGLAIREATAYENRHPATNELMGMRGETDVIYRPQGDSVLVDDPVHHFWSRRLADFNAYVDREHGRVPRFVKEHAMDEKHKALVGAAIAHTAVVEAGLKWKRSALQLLTQVERMVSTASERQQTRSARLACRCFLDDHPPEREIRSDEFLSDAYNRDEL